MMKNHIAFFDLDNTILNSNSGIFFVEQAYKSGLLKKRDLARAFYLSMIYKLDLIEPEKIINKMAIWLKGLPEKQIIDLSMKVFNSSIKGAIREAARETIHFHKNNNGKTVILSAATTYICAHVKHFIHIDDMICTEMEVIDGYFTGIPKGNYCYGAEKLQRLQFYCESVNCKIEETYYYADSYSDLPVLEAVGQPRCVTPDERLLKVARERGWTVCQW